MMKKQTADEPEGACSKPVPGLEKSYAITCLSMDSIVFQRNLEKYLVET